MSGSCGQCYNEVDVYLEMSMFEMLIVDCIFHSSSDYVLESQNEDVDRSITNTWWICICC